MDRYNDYIIITILPLLYHQLKAIPIFLSKFRTRRLLNLISKYPKKLFEYGEYYCKECVIILN